MLYWLWHSPRALLRVAALLVCGLFAASGCRREANPNLLQGRAPSSITHAKNAERLTDGVRAVTGDTWNSNLASVLELGASVEWDLGASESLAAAVIKADHDDEYALLASDDRKAW